ncbi:LacI family transcriptional regulator [Vibrio crassostreae]|uniref:LacI family DNA-binding transcriptional regulator n=1 Tax=Vibrio crassostreae TaxID=246167 RepID=UPI0005E261D1|nr:LacI family DNA-binding transcriptional regulator [Vibrio crassostreae]TCT60214.1 LacI family transcriptional regulator [Vibrio crassostreae]TCT75759.1 LacI family transcriptional regulator [Vibrio crassostreae]TCT81956.1 LacI family transcriptional regulator [Vibrio crassostreae]TCU02798.1 LacI family transcriptional regulator [Vibrio crassostreae]TDW09331.1 LacI family transcriptional regulator [Vibrio crassostreae]
MKVTIKDVAKKANVSIATVSYAMNDCNRVSEKTRQHVLNIANEMNYVANTNAKQLKQRRSYAIGLFLNNWFGPIYSELVKGIEKVCHQRGYDLVACSMYGNENSTAHKYIRDRVVDGAVVLTNSFDTEFLKSVAGPDFPMVVLDRELNAPGIYNILIDNFGGAFSATKELALKGCKDIYFFTGPDDSYDSKKRLDGYISALGYFNLPVKNHHLIKSDFTEKTAYKQMKDILEQGRRPDAVFAANDEMAIGILRAAKRYEIDIPNEMKLVGFDNIRMAELMIPSLSTVTHEKEGMGELAASTLINALDDKTDKLQALTILPTSLILRETL